jgi:hypothetical protein
MSSIFTVRPTTVSAGHSAEWSAHLAPPSACTWVCRARACPFPSSVARPHRLAFGDGCTMDLHRARCARRWYHPVAHEQLHYICSISAAGVRCDVVDSGMACSVPPLDESNRRTTRPAGRFASLQVRAGRVCAQSRLYGVLCVCVHACRLCVQSGVPPGDRYHPARTAIIARQSRPIRAPLASTHAD